MRLLERDSAGKPNLTKDFVGDNIPEYAILSHTWGVDTEEVTFKDLMDGTGKDKSGYKKICFCGEQARRDGLQYFWVDTCCIDKSSSAVLSEAIISMFRWYHNAAQCYVYLSDISRLAFDANGKCNQLPWESTIQNSKWFTRGWTLQELLAPATAKFFSKDWEQLGDKKSLERTIYEITGIPVRALQGSPLSNFSVTERLLWAAKRETTREEDKAYSLLGIFNIQIPVLYGEGGENAFKRLREEIDKPSRAQNFGLDCLPSAADALFNSYNKQHAPTCLPDTRVDLLQEIYDWANGQDERCIFWLNGLAGTGKSTIARTVARTYFDRKRLGASFFFSRGGRDVSHVGKFFTSIAVQLADSVPSFQRHICDAVADRSDIASLSLRDQWHQLVLYPLSKLDCNACQCSYVLIVDALDECDDGNDVQIILQLLAEARSLETVRLRVFLTSRPEVPIRHNMYRIPQAEHQDFVLQNIPPVIVNHDISLFLEYNLGIIGQEWTLGAGWPGEQAIRQLVLNASGLFIWAATACRFIHDGREFAERRLSLILQSDGSATAPERHLNEIYTTVLKNSISQGYDNSEREYILLRFRKVLGSIVILSSPLSASSISKLLDVTTRQVAQTVNHLHAILNIPEDQTCPLRLHHPSFRDFLLNKERCSDSRFQVDKKQAHQTLAYNCIRLMSNSFSQDVWGQETPGTLVADIESSRIEQRIPPEVRYACLYWIRHLQESNVQLYDNDQFHQFLQEHLLRWLEALGWIGEISEGILAITSLESIALTSKCPRLYSLVHDIKRFALHNHLVIKLAPRQVYFSALVFAPAKSIVRQHFADQIPCRIHRLPDRQKNWGAALQTLEGHTAVVNAIAFSPDGKQLASASHDKTIRLWDAATGAALQILETNESNIVVFSPVGKQLASFSDIQIIRLSDPDTGAVLHMLKGHTAAVYDIAFSPDGKQLASTSEDKTVRLWDTVAGIMLQTFEGHTAVVYSVAFSPDGKQLASSSEDKTVRLWDTRAGLLQTLEDQTRPVIVIFSRDGKLASASYDGTVRLWDAVNGDILHTFANCIGWGGVAFSPDGMQLALALNDTSVRLWDAISGNILRTFGGYSDEINAISFSPDGKQLASTAARTVRLWDVATGKSLPTLEGHPTDVHAIAFSRDGKQLASASYDGTVKVWDAAALQALEDDTAEDRTAGVDAITFSPDGKQLALGLEDMTVQIWDAATCDTLHVLDPHLNWINAVAFSPDGKQLASASYHTVRLLDVATGATLQTLEGYTSTIHAIAFSPDGAIIINPSVPTNIPDQSNPTIDIFVKDQWIVRRGDNFLWLPTEYRLIPKAIHKTTIAMGCTLKQALILEFKI